MISPQENDNPPLPSQAEPAKSQDEIVLYETTEWETGQAGEHKNILSIKKICVTNKT